MKKLILSLAVLAMAMAPAAPALAGWKLVDKGTPTAVAKGKMTITPGENWNRWSVRPIKKSEIWTLDGTNLNEVYFVTGLIAGETLYRDINKKERPLPAFSKTAQLTDIPEFVESSMRIALNTSVYTTTGVEPTTLAGQPGVKFQFEYSVTGSPLLRKGMAAGTIVDGQLHLVTFVAPATHFYDRDRPKVEAMLASLKL